MTLTANRKANKADPRDVGSRPVAATTVIYRGSGVCADSSGNAVAPSAATGLITLGVAEHESDNSVGSAGATKVEFRRGTFGFTNSADSDAITDAEIGDVCYWVDGGTVAKTNGSNTRSVAGVVEFIEASLVYVQIGTWPLQVGLLSANNLSDVGTAATARANIGANKATFQAGKISSKAADAEVYRFVADKAGTLTGVKTVINAALATGDATVQVKVNGTNSGSTTTGLITITQSASAAGDVDTCTPLTTNLTFVAGDVVSLTVGGASTATATFNAEVAYTY
jgi:hypothetical protein